MRKIVGFMAVLILLGFTAAAEEPAGEVNAYYYAAYADSAAVQQRLKSAGFEVLAAYAPTPKCETLVVSCPGLKSMAAKPKRGFGAVMRVLVDGENRRVAYMNPLYFSKAFLQDDYDYATAQKVADKLKAALGEGTPSPDKQDYDELGGYHFMMGMPYYEDMDELAEGDDAALLKKLEAFEGGKHIVFKLDLGEGRTLVGYELADETEKFVNKIGAQNAEVLPYTVLIEDGKATALAAKYYLAVSYPLLSMGQFMTIAGVPGTIEKELKQPFN
jgi:hypothetical protein